MLKKIIMPLAALCLGSLSANAQLQKFCVPSVAPSHNVTSLEFAPGMTVIDSGGSSSLTSVTSKMYYAFSPEYNIGVEIPVSRFESPNKSVNGLGDVMLASEAVYRTRHVDLGAKMDITLPTAANDKLGAGKFQAMPSVYALLPLSKNFFISAGYKHVVSVAGNGSRDNINYGRWRMLLSYMDDSKWWVTFDPQYYVDYEHSGQAELVWESEVGVMINPGSAIYIKPGAHLGGNWDTRDWTLTMGFKILYL